ncbi:MAG: hypothetical protein FJX57_02105 [Alphaproteobacteria bacterium]|nr:hypothetical protein [Alphaproteobacteria bacterium]
MIAVTKLKSNSTIEARNNYSRAIAIDDWIVVANTAGRDFKTRAMPTDAAYRGAGKVPAQRVSVVL